MPYPSLYGVERLFLIDPRQPPPLFGLGTGNVNLVSHEACLAQENLERRGSIMCRCYLCEKACDLWIIFLCVVNLF
ncbi:hypothetical protein H5410_012993, partial [Solanum commersonii]